MRIRGFAPSTPCWAELTTSEPAAAGFFYAEAFGWDLDGDRFTRHGRAVAGLVRGRDDHAEGWLTYLATADLEDTGERVTTAYGRTLVWPQERPGARTAVVRDASGAVFGLWQASGFAGGQLRAEPGTMAWSDLLTDDVPAATAFYGSVFGWQLTHDCGGGEWLTAGHDSVAGLVTGRGGNRWRPSFQVADTAETANQCVRLGGRVLTGPVEMGLGSYVEIADPFGGTFAITSPAHCPVEPALAFHDAIGMELTYGG